MCRLLFFYNNKIFQILWGLFRMGSVIENKRSSNDMLSISEGCQGAGCERLRAGAGRRLGGCAVHAVAAAAARAS